MRPRQRPLTATLAPLGVDLTISVPVAGGAGFAVDERGAVAAAPLGFAAGGDAGAPGFAAGATACSLNSRPAGAGFAAADPVVAAAWLAGGSAGDIRPRRNQPPPAPSASARITSSATGAAERPGVAASTSTGVYPSDGA